MTGSADNGAQEGAQGNQGDQVHRLTPEQWEAISRTLMALEPLTDDERLWRAQTLRGSLHGLSDGEHALGVVFLVEDFRLPDVLERIEAGQIVIIVPTPDDPA